MTDRELMQQALEALERVNTSVWLEDCYHAFDEEVTALRERLAQPEQELVAHTLNCICGAVWDVSPNGVEEMVHAPNPPQRKPLTDEEIGRIAGDSLDAWSCARAIEAAHGIKENT